jgi:hypothetical protein
MLPTTTSKASYLPRAALKSNNFYDRFAPYQHVERKDAIPTATSVPTRADPGRRMGSSGTGVDHTKPSAKTSSFVQAAVLVPQRG